MILLLLVLSLTVYLALRRALFEQFDAGLESTAQFIAAVIEQDVDELEVGLEVQQMPEFRDANHQAYFQLWGPQEAVLAKSPSLGRDDLWQIGAEGDSTTFVNLPARGGKALRAIGVRFIAQPADKDLKPPPALKPMAMRLTVARDATELHRELRFLRWLLALASSAVAALSLLLAALVVRHGLAPLRTMAAQIGAIRTDDLTARVAAEPALSEIAPIKDRLNDLLSRLQMSFQRERRFTSDVAHELRTPLAGLRSSLEVTLLRSRPSQEYQAVLSDCLGIVQTMQTMVNNLLTLARLDTRQMVFRRDPILLADLVDACWRPFTDEALRRHLTFESALADDLTCPGDADNLSMVITNLLANASEYANDGGRICVTAQSTDGHVELTIANTGCTLTQPQIAQVFDCFWRGDSSRQNPGVHCGLGLALVKRVMTALGGAATAELQAGGIFAVRLDLGRDSTARG